MNQGQFQEIAGPGVKRSRDDEIDSEDGQATAGLDGDYEDGVDEMRADQGYSNATSLIPTPIYSPKIVDQPPTKRQKKPTVKFGASSNPVLVAERDVYAKRHDDFLRAHADVYLALLPESNSVSRLFTAAALKKKVHLEAVPYKLIAQPKMIEGGTLKGYQLAGVSFLAYMYENGQNCILADE